MIPGLFLGIQSPSVLNTHPARGLSWEAFVIDQLISRLQSDLPGSQPYSRKTSQGDEVDLLMDMGGRLVSHSCRKQNQLHGKWNHRIAGGKSTFGR